MKQPTLLNRLPRLTGALTSLALATLASGCTDETEAPPPLKVVALYDFTAVASLETDPEPRFTWQPDPLVSASCGPERAPNGLGRPEAELIANRQFPVLAIVLEHTSDTNPGPVRADQLRLYLDSGQEGGDEPSYTFLQPAVLPLRLQVTPNTRTVTPLLGQTLFFQMAVQLCAEHKLERAWLGSAEETLLNEAFMRSEPEDPTLAFFRGQGQSVPAQLGPMSWSLDLYKPDLPRWLQEVWGEWPSDVLVANTLVEADIWGARAPKPPRPSKGQEAIGPRLKRMPMLPFRSGQGEVCAPRYLADRFDDPDEPCLIPLEVPELALEVEMSESTETPGATRLKTILRGTPDQQETVLIDHDLKDDARADDLAARLPRYLPRFRSSLYPSRTYTLLLIPDWQIARALGPTQGKAGTPELRTAVDGLGYLKHHLDMLHLQYVPFKASRVQNLLYPLRGTWSQMPGYSPGLWAASAPVMLPEDVPEQTVSAAQHRAVFHSSWVAPHGIALLLLLWMGMRGLARFGELWQSPPIERAAFWPGEMHNRLTEDVEAEPERKARGGAKSSSSSGGPGGETR